MDLDEARALLNTCKRQECRDHAFGDMEVYWTKDGEEVAEGYYGGHLSDISFVEGTTFTGIEASGLFDCGTLAHVERNDTTGPDDFVRGRMMPGLTMEGVYTDLARRNIFEDKDAS